MTKCKNCNESFFSKEHGDCSIDTDMEIAFCDNCDKAYHYQWDDNRDYIIPDFSRPFDDE